MFQLGQAIAGNSFLSPEGARRIIAQITLENPDAFISSKSKPLMELRVKKKLEHHWREMDGRRFSEFIQLFIYIVE